MNDDAPMVRRTGHLRATTEEATLTEFEFSALHLMEAFRRWTIQCMRAAANYDIGYYELLVLHVVRMHDRPKDAATIANILNRDDIPNIQYSLRKLVAADLIEKGRCGITITFAVTEKGQIVTDRYAELRRELLLPQLAHLGDFRRTIVDVRRLLMLMTGIYDQTARVVAAYGPPSDFTFEVPWEAPAETAAPPKRRRKTTGEEAAPAKKRRRNQVEPPA